MIVRVRTSLILGGTSGLGEAIAKKCKDSHESVIVLGSSIKKEYKNEQG